jgi:phenylpropionate dioxygenase-like ring-hydroxylating dioxygenase large terminal subunit
MTTTQVTANKPASDHLPAGGDAPDRFDPSEAWYPVHYIEDLDKSKPTPFTLLDRDLVLWWDREGGEWRAMRDRCPHRLARLSEGRIAEDGLLECPYHGWAFTGEGTCDRIPQQLPDAKAQTSRRACVESFPTAVRQGLLFVYPGTPDRADRTPIPIVPAIDESPDEWLVMDIFRDLPYDALTLLENVLDPSHLPYTHHGTVGKRANASPVELAITSADKSGFTGTWAEGPRRGTLGRQDTTFIAPNLMWHDLTSKQFGRTLTVVYATPTRKGFCRLFARFPFKFVSKIPAFFIKLTPKWYSHANNNVILEDDQIFLHYQERYLAEQGGSDHFSQVFYLPTKADLFVFEYRQWINQYQADPFPGQPFPPLQSPEELLDRYHSHTKNCKSCQQTYRNLKQLRFAIVVVSIVSWVAGSILALGGSVTALIPAITAIAFVPAGALIWWFLGIQLAKLERGSTTPPRNLPVK